MNIRQYETRLTNEGFVKLDTVFSKYIPEIKNHFTNAEKVYQLCKVLGWDTYSEEHVFLLGLDIKKRLRGFFEIGVGDQNTCIIDVRGIGQKVLLLNASCMLLVHNHPSGDPTPSKYDQDVSGNLKIFGNILGIPFMDSIILGNGAYISFMEKGIL